VNTIGKEVIVLGKEDWIDRFVAHLEALRDREDRGALAALRRGLGSQPGTVSEMYPHILPWAPHGKHAEEACYVVGSLFAFHPQKEGVGTIGRAFSMVQDRSESLEKRFVVLLNCHRDDLPNYLRQAISLLKAKDIPVNWRQLLHDVLYWDHDAHFVQQQWARDFWQGRPRETQGEEEEMGL
jgi:CRISPR system Cascade subunit CasB